MSDKIKRGVAFPKQVIDGIESRRGEKSFGSMVVELLKKAMGIK